MSDIDEETPARVTEGPGTAAEQRTEMIRLLPDYRKRHEELRATSRTRAARSQERAPRQRTPETVRSTYRSNF